MVPKVMIILGSASDIEIAKKTMNILEKLEIPYSLKIASAHRTHELVSKIVIEATKAGVEVFIGIAGLAAHLPGSIASYTHRPVIGVPVDVKLEGIDALYASVQMPYPTPVSTVGIDRGDNAGLLAGQIIGVYDEKIRNNVSKLRAEYKQKVINSEKEVLENINGKYLDKDFLSTENLDYENQEYKPSFYIEEKKETGPSVAIVPGSYSDMVVAKKVAVVLGRLKIPYEMQVISPVRHADKFENFVNSMEDVKLFIGINGLSAQITGALVGLSEKPVIGVPCTTESHIDSLLSMINMPPGVPVGTVGINNGRNGAMLAGEILALKNPKIEENLKKIKYKKANL